MGLPVVLKWGKRDDRHTFLGRPILEALHLNCDLLRKGKTPSSGKAKADPKPVDESAATRRKAAAAKAWETMRAKKLQAGA
jgi:hypothetical protein